MLLFCFILEQNFIQNILFYIFFKGNLIDVGKIVERRNFILYINIYEIFLENVFFLILSVLKIYYNS